VDAGNYWRWRLFATIDPRSDYWIEAIDFKGNGMSDADDYETFRSRYCQTVPYE
jgi:hypothetical protein